MTEAEVQAFCANNGISVSPPGQALHVVDPESLPPSVRAFVNDDGSYKGDNTPEAETARHEESKGEADSDPNAVAKSPMQAERSDSPKKQGKLPDDFPGYAALAAAGISTYAQLRKAGDVTKIEGIGPATAEKIETALSEDAE